MKKDDNILNKYFESARNHKSPVSGTYARNLLGNSDLKKSVPKKFVFKKGVKTMSIISTLTVGASILAISLGVFNPSTEQTANDNSKTATRAAVSQNLQHGKASKELQNISIAKNTTPNSTNANETNTTNSDYISQNVISIHKVGAEKVEPLRKIEMTYDELEEFGFQFDTLSYKNEVSPSIVYYDRVLTQPPTVTVQYNNYSSAIHSSAFFMPDSGKFDYFLPASPSMISEYDGTKRLYSNVIGDSRSTVHEFIPFYSSLSYLNYMTMPPELSPKSLPDSIKNRMTELELTLTYFINNKTSKINNDITDQLIRRIISYYESIIKAEDAKSKSNPNSNPNPFNIDTTKPFQIIHGFVENPEDSVWIQDQQEKAKMGIYIFYKKQPVNVLEIIRKELPTLVEKIKSLAKQAEDYVQTNDMIAIDVPFKDDPKHEGLVFWFLPSKELIEALPERYRVGLSKELELKNNGVTCGQHFEEATYMDSWRACSGAIENLRVFPNPVVKIVNVKFDLKEAREMKFAIHSLNGNKLTDLPLLQKFEKGTNTVTLDLSMLTSGMYLLVASSPEGETTVQRIIKE